MKILMLVMIVFVVGCSTVKSTKGFLIGQGYQAVPLKKNAVGHFQVLAKVNGVLGSFILDTGASGTVLEKSHLKKFKVSQVGTPTEASGLGTTKNSAQIVKVKAIQIGSFVRRNLQIVSTDLSHVNTVLKKNGAEAQDGVVGADLLKSGRAVIDYGSQTLFLRN